MNTDEVFAAFFDDVPHCVVPHRGPYAVCATWACDLPSGETVYYCAEHYNQTISQHSIPASYWRHLGPPAWVTAYDNMKGNRT